MPRPTITDPALTIPGQRVLSALSRYHYLTLSQLNTLLHYEPESKYVEKAVRKLAGANLVFNGNYLPKRADLNGSVKRGASPLVVSVREPSGRSAKRRDPRQQLEYLEHVIPTNDVLIAMELFGAEQGLETTILHDLHLHEIMRGVIPDGYVGYAWEDYKAGFAIELDRGTESFDDRGQGSTWFKKITGLLKLGSGLYREYFPYEALKIAVVVRSGGIGTKTSEWRMKDLIHWMERVIVQSQYDDAWGDFFRFTTADPTTMTPTEFVMNDHWVIPFTYEGVSLLPLS